MKLLSIPSIVDLALLTAVLLDDFRYYVTGDLWTSTLTDSGSVTVEDSANGVIAITPSDGTVANNDEAYVFTTKDNFLFAPSKPLDVTSLVQFTEGATDDANIFVGFSSAAIANTLVDDGAGPPANYSGACFFKVDGGLNWHVEFSNATTQETVELTAANSLDGVAHVAGTASAFQALRIVTQPTSSQKMDLMFFIDGTLVYKMKDKDITSAAAMKYGYGIKNGAATTVETLRVDLVTGGQTR